MISPAQPTGPPPLLLDVREAAELLRVSPRTLARWSADGRAPGPVKIIGGQKGTSRYRYSDLAEWVAGGCEPVGEVAITGNATTATASPAIASDQEPRPPPRPPPTREPTPSGSAGYISPSPHHQRRMTCPSPGSTTPLSTEPPTWGLQPCWCTSCWRSTRTRTGDAGHPSPRSPRRLGSPVGRPNRQSRSSSLRGSLPLRPSTTSMGGVGQTTTTCHTWPTRLRALLAAPRGAPNSAGRALLAARGRALLAAHRTRTIEN